MKINIFNETSNPKRFRLIKVNGSLDVSEADNPTLMSEGDIVTSCLTKAGSGNRMWSFRDLRLMWKKNINNFMWSYPREQFLQWNANDATQMWNVNPNEYMWRPEFGAMWNKDDTNKQWSNNPETLMWEDV